MDRQRAQLLRPQHARPADEQREVQRMAVAVGRPQAARPELPGLVVDPVVEVGLGKRRGGGHASRAARCRDVDDLLLRHRHQIAQRRDRLLPIAQHPLLDEREPAQVVESAEPVGADARSIERRPVERRAVIRQPQMVLQAGQLQRVPLGAALRLQVRLPVGAGLRRLRADNVHANLPLALPGLRYLLSVPSAAQ